MPWLDKLPAIVRVVLFALVTLAAWFFLQTPYTFWGAVLWFALAVVLFLAVVSTFFSIVETIGPHWVKAILATIAAWISFHWLLPKIAYNAPRSVEFYNAVWDITVLVWLAFVITAIFMTLQNLCTWTFQRGKEWKAWQKQAKREKAVLTVQRDDERSREELRLAAFRRAQDDAAQREAERALRKARGW